MGSNPILAAADPLARRELGPSLARLPGGGLAERSKAHAWKACRGATPSRVRTPQPPPRRRVTHLRVGPGGCPLVRARSVPAFAGNLTDDPVVRYTEGGIARAMRSQSQ